MNHETQQANGLPAGWVWTTLGDIAELVGGGTPTRERPEYFSGNIVWLTPTEIPKVGVTVVRDSKERITEDALRRSSARLVPAGSVLMTSRASIGYIAVAGTDLTTNQGFASFVPRESVYNFYLAYWLRANTELFIQHATGTTFKEITKSKLRPLAFPLAPFPEQHRIVAEIETQFTRLDAGVAALKRVQAKLRRYNAALLKAACEGLLVTTEAELARVEGRPYEPASALLARILAERCVQWQHANPGKRYVEPKGVESTGLPELPKGWVWATVEQLADVIGGLTKNQKRSSYPLQLPYLRVANVYANQLQLDDVQAIGVQEAELRRSLLQPGDLLVVEGNGSQDQIGRVALWNGAIDPCVHQNHIIKARFHLVDLAQYVLYWLLSKIGRDQITKVASSTSGLYTLSLSKVQSLMVPLPPLAEQHRIVAEVERRLSVAQEVESTVAASLKRAERLRQSILKRAFEGRLVPQDPSDEPASMLLERIKSDRQSFHSRT